ncbi:MAG: B-box zinc finger protein [Deltaproteobacteria bacterium]|nr:B-box zinc finger protein [Deltaproteobacteria bacterium]
MHTCTKHMNARAAWRCSKCDSTLCPACAVTANIQRTEIIRCLSCGGVAQQIMTQKVIVPYWGMFGVFLQAIFSLTGLLQILALAAMVFLSSLIPIVGWVISLGIYAGYYFLVITRYSFGEEKLPIPADFSDVFDDIFAPFFRFIIGTLLVWVPALLYINAHVGFGLMFSSPAAAFSDPILILIILVSIAYFPGVMITAAVTQSTLAMLNPMIILGIILRIPGHYFLTVIVWGMMTVANAFLRNLVGPILYEHHVFLLTGILNEAVGLLIPMLTAMVLGRLVYQNGETLGYHTPKDLTVPEFPGATPQATAPQGGWEQPKAIQAPIEPIELEEDSSSAVLRPAPGGGFVAAGGPPAATKPKAQPQPAPAAPTAASPTNLLENALQTSDNQAALQAFKKLTESGQVPDLEPQLELRLANLLERSGQSLAAAHACRRAAEKDMQGPMASRAIFTSARLLVEKLGQKQQGAAMYKYLVENFPGDPLSERAREMLRRLKGSGV